MGHFLFGLLLNSQICRIVDLWGLAKLLFSLIFFMFILSQSETQEFHFCVLIAICEMLCETHQTCTPLLVLCATVLPFLL